MRILLVEDNADHRELMRLVLTGHDATWRVEGVVSGEEALRHLAEGDAYDLVFLDYSLPTRDGLEVLAEIRRGEAPPPVVMVTGRGDEQVAVEAMKGGAYDYIVKGEGYLQRLSVVAQRAVEAHQTVVERKRAEEALRESEAQLRELYDGAPVGYHEFDGEGRIRRVNRTELAMLGYTAEEMIGRPVWEFVLEREAAHRAVLSKLAGSGLVPAFERTYLRKDGTQVPVLIEDRLLRDAEGGVSGIRSTIQDISARKQAEEAARENQRVLEAVLETTRALIVLADSEGRILLFNRACEELTGHSRQEVLGKSIADCFPDQAWTSIALKLLVDRGGPGLLVPHECPWQAASGEQRLIEWRFRVFPSPHDGRPCVLGTGIDITARKRAEEALRVRTQQLEAVRAVSTEITRELDLTTLLELITRRAAELVGATSGTVRLWDEEAQLLIPVAWHGLGEWVKDQRRRLSEGVSGAVAQRREGMVVNDVRTSPYALPAPLEQTKITAILAEPLIYRDDLLGVLTVDKHEPGSSFSEGDQELFRLFAAQAAIAIENARLHSAAVRRGEELEALLRATRSVMSGLDLQGILDRILTEAAVMSACPNVKIFLVDRKAGTLQVEAVRGMAVQQVGSVLPLGSGLTGLAAQTGQPVFSEDLTQDPRNLVAQQDRELGLVTYLGLPIRIRDEILGVLTFRTTAPRHYPPDEVAYLTSFADQAAIAIENARLYERVRTGRERLQRLSHRLVELQESEHRSIARELHDEIGQLLTGLKLLLEMSARVRPEKLTPPLSEAQALVNELIMRVREMSLDLRPSMLDDLGLLPALLWHFERYTAQTHVRVNLQHSGLDRRFSPEIETAAYRIVQEALSNVARHAGVTEVSVRLWVDQNTLGVQIQDQGAGFDPEAALAAATSIGLVGMRERAALFGGSLTVESVPGAGTRVMAELPLTGRVEKRKRER